MKSIGEISVGVRRRAGFLEFSSCKEREKAQPQEPQHSGPHRGGGTDCARS